MSALNGRGHVAAPNPIREMELGGLEMPVGERPPALEALNARLAKVARPLDPETALAVHTAYLAGWRDSWWHSAVIRAREVRAAMDDRPTAVVHAVVTSAVPDDPAAVGRRS